MFARRDSMPAFSLTCYPPPEMGANLPPEQDPDRDRTPNTWATGLTGCLVFLAIASLILGVVWFLLGGSNNGSRL